MSRSILIFGEQSARMLMYILCLAVLLTTVSALFDYPPYEIDLIIPGCIRTDDCCNIIWMDLILLVIRKPWRDTLDPETGLISYREIIVLSYGADFLEIGNVIYADTVEFSCADQRPDAELKYPLGRCKGCHRKMGKWRMKCPDGTRVKWTEGRDRNGEVTDTAECENTDESDAEELGANELEEGAHPGVLVPTNTMCEDESAYELPEEESSDEELLTTLTHNSPQHPAEPSHRSERLQQIQAQLDIILQSMASRDVLMAQDADILSLPRLDAESDAFHGGHTARSP